MHIVAKTAFVTVLASSTLIYRPATAETNIYLGASGGQTTVEQDFDGLDFDESTGSWKAFAGVRFGLLGIEAGYVDLGNPDTTIAGTDVEVGITGIELFGTANVDAGPAVLFAKAGAIDWDSEVDVGNVNLDDDGTDWAYGVGASLGLTEGFAIRAEYELFDIGDADEVNMMSLGVQLGM